MVISWSRQRKWRGARTNDKFVCKAGVKPVTPWD